MPGYISFGNNGIVATQNYIATYEGIKILEKGGNAFDAAITVSSVLSVVLPHTGGIGGDGFIIAYIPDKVIGFNGSGKSSVNFNVEDFLKFSPLHGPLTITVPALLKVWDWIINKFSTIDLKETLKPAIRLCFEGFNVSEELHNAIIRRKKEFINYRNWNKLFGNLELGDRLVQKELGEVLQIISNKGIEEFYNGDLAKEITDELVEQNVPIDVKDFENCKGFEFEPLKSTYFDYDVFEIPPNSQGVSTLEMLSLIEEYLKEFKFDDFKRIEIQAKLASIVYKDRDNYVSDPDYLNFDVSKLFSKENIKGRREIRETLALKNDDTTFFVIGDKHGNMVGFIQSLFHPFGSGIVSKGIVFQNRAIGFSKDKRSPNYVGRSKRPLHTLSILFAKNNKRKVMIGCAGGDLRPQIHSQILQNLVNYNMNLREAIDAPRFMLTEYKNGYKIIIEKRFNVKDIKDLTIKELNYYSREVGIVNALIEEKGIYQACSDPRSEGISLGI